MIHFSFIPFFDKLLLIGRFLLQLELVFDQVKLRHAAKSLSFEDLIHGQPDDEPQMFDLRARLLACLDDSVEQHFTFD